MLSKDTIIIIAIFSALGAFVILLLLIRVLGHVTSTSAPLPPIQPLAHHRELHIAKLEAALPSSQSWYPTPSLTAHNSFGTPSPRGSSTASLIPKHFPPSPDGTTTTETLSAFSPASSHALALPNPSFHPARPGSSSSLALSSEPGHTNPPSSASSSYISSPSISPRERSSMTNLRTPTNTLPSRRQRPMSVTSSHSTIHSKASRNTLRGLPHSCHSQIQIVLPEPLSVGADRPGGSIARRMTVMNPLDHSESFDCRSVVDRWILASDSSPEIPIVPTKGPVIRHSRVMSQPEVQSSAAAFMTSPSAPPVPRVPSMYIDLDSERQLNRMNSKSTKAE